MKAHRVDPMRRGMADSTECREREAFDEWRAQLRIARSFFFVPILA